MKRQNIFFTLLISIAILSCGKKDEIAEVAVDSIPLKQKVVTGYFEGKDRVNLFIKMQGKGEPLIVLPGGPGYSFEYLQPYLSQLDSHFQLIFLDPRGCGKSDILADPSKYTLDNMVADVESLKSTLQLKSFNLLAHETGTFVAQKYVIKNPGHVNKMILMSSTAQIFDLNMWLNGFRDFMPRATAVVIKKYEQDSMYVDEQYNLGYEQTVMSGILTQGYFFNPTLIPADFTLPEKSWDVYNTIWGRGGYFNITGNISDFDTREQLQTVNVKTLVMCGQHDYFAPFVMETLVGAIPSADMYVFENAAHFFYIEKHDEFIEKIKEFLKK